MICLTVGNGQQSRDHASARALFVDLNRALAQMAFLNAAVRLPLRCTDLAPYWSCRVSQWEMETF